MDIREVREEDLPELLALCERALPLDRFTMHVLRDRMLGEPDHNPAYQLGAWDGGRLAGALLAGSRETQQGRATAVRLFAVDPQHRRRGVASRLLGEIERRVRGDGFSRLGVGKSSPVYFWPGVDVRYTPALCFLEKHGYSRSDAGFNMEVDLRARSWDTSAAEARLEREGFQVRRLRADDREAFGSWVRGEWGDVWEYEALRSYGNDPVSTWVALRDGQVCSFASYNVTGFENSFGPTGTQPELRGQGLGRVMFHRCMRDLRELGHDTCEVSWVGPFAFYARVADARISRVFWAFEKEL
jgi:GNAT superfamily N-acetyltransferase